MLIYFKLIHLLCWLQEQHASQDLAFKEDLEQVRSASSPSHKDMILFYV